jgi:hypothetical protein
VAPELFGVLRSTHELHANRDGRPTSVTKLYVLIGICAIFAFINVPLAVNGEAIRVQERDVRDGWHKECVYYIPVRLLTVRIRNYSECPLRRRV